jgi:hypothetical protein
MEKNFTDYKYHYFYKTTNNINGKYYYGMHSTNNLDDGYKGSGVLLREAFNKYGKDNFTTEILKFFDTREELSEYERIFIDDKLIGDDMCYNIGVGGIGGFLSNKIIVVRDKDGNVYVVSKDDPRFLSGELVSIFKDIPKSDKAKENISKGVKRFYDTDAGLERRKQIEKERMAYWESEEGNDMKKRISDNNKKFYATERGKDIKSRGLETRRRNGVSKERRDDQSRKIKDYWNSENGIKRKEEIHKNALEQFHKKVTIVKYSLYDISTGEKVPVMENVGRIDMVRYFGVKGINVDKYVDTGAIYKGKYIIEKIVTEEVSKKTYYLKEIKEGDLL